MRTRRVILFAFLVLSSAQTGFTAGTTSAAFLRLGSGARSAALGEAFTARADDASATYWNPAGLSRLPSRELMAEHVFHIQDISIDRLAYAHPLGGPGRGALGVSVTYLSLGGIEARTSNTALPDRTFGASDFYGAVSYARQATSSLSVGVTGKAVRQQIDTHDAATFAADLGFLYSRGRLQAGATLSNLGPDVQFVDRAFPLPRTLRAGLAYDMAGMPLKLSLETEKLKDESSFTYRMGVEYDSGGLLALRGGYLSRSGSSADALKGGGLGSSAGGVGRLVGVAGGFGLRLGRYRFDYAFTPFGEQGNAHKMSFTARF